MATPHPAVLHRQIANYKFEKACENKPADVVHIAKVYAARRVREVQLFRLHKVDLLAMLSLLSPAHKLSSRDTHRDMVWLILDLELPLCLHALAS